MATSLASPRAGTASRIRNPLCDSVDHFRNKSCSTSRVPESAFRITPYGHESTYPYGHYQRPVNYEGPLDDVKQKIRASKVHSKFVVDEDNYSSGNDSDGELDEKPRRHKVKKLGVL